MVLEGQPSGRVGHCQEPSFCLSLLIFDFDGFIGSGCPPLIRAETLFEFVGKEFLLFLFYVLSLEQCCGFSLL